MHRDTRRFLVVLVVALTVALAGCGGGGGTATPGDDGDGAASDGNADDSDGADGTDGSADSDGSDGSNGDATPTAVAEAGGTATAASTPTATGTMAGPGTPTSTPTPNASGSSGADESAGPLLENVIRSPEEFRYRVETSTAEGTYVQVGRWHGDDFYGKIESMAGMDQSYEVYSVDGELDTVIGGQCMDMGQTQQIQNPRNTSQGDYNLSTRPVGTDTVDGKSVHVYEVQTEQPAGTMTFYVDTESGYVLRMEYMQTTYEYWDFGNVEPVESPC